MSNAGTEVSLDIIERGDDILNWTLDKQEAAKYRLWKEFGLSQYLNDKILLQQETISDDEYRFSLDTFRVRDHFMATLSHKKFINRSFSRFQKYFESIGLSKEQVNKHDDSKLTSFQEIVGYTDRWIWNIKTNAWNKAWIHHYTNNPHHPEYYINSDENGKKVQRDMGYVDLVESVVDMIACRWERVLRGNEAVTNQMLLDIHDSFLKRYTYKDQINVRKLINQLSQIENSI